MKLNKPKKIILGILLILVICALSTIVPQVTRIFKLKNKQHYLRAYKENINSKYVTIAKEYRAFPEIFESEKPVLVYGYISGGLDKAQSDIFHNKLTELLKENDISQKVVAVKDWKKTKEKLENKHLNEDDLTCTTVTESIQNLENYFDFIDTCLSNACVIDKKNNTYIEISRNEEFIIKTLKGEVEITDNTEND